MTDKTKEALARSALKLALDYLEPLARQWGIESKAHGVCTAIRLALTEEFLSTEQPAIKQDLTPEQPTPVAEPRKPQQEPVATLEDFEQEIYENTREFVSRNVMEWMFNRYYTAPPYEATPLASQRSVKPWLRLTDEEVKHEWVVWRASIPRYMGFAKGIEAKLKEKNSD